MPVEGVFWWSFSPNYSFEEFINRLFVFARIFLPEKDLPDNLDGARHKEKLTYIFMLLRQRRLLLVLDGFESQLTYKAMASEEMQTESGRSCESRLASDFLIEATTKIMRSRVLLTTQCLPMELDDDKLCRKLWLRPLIKEIASRVSSVALADYSFPDENRQQIHALVEAVSWLDYRGNLNPVYPFEELTESHTIDPQRVQWVIKVYKRAKEISAGQIFLVGTAEVVKSMELDRKRPGLFQWLRSMQLIPALKSLIADLIARLLDLASAIKDKSLSRVSRILYSPFLADFSRPPEKQQQPGFSFGGKQAEIELLSALLAKGPSPSLSSGAVNLFATILSRLGGNQALTPPVVSAMRHQAVDPVYEGLGEEKGFAAITIQQLKMGRFGSARQSLSREIELCREIGDTDRERAGNLMLRVMKDGGDFLDRMNFRIHTFSNERSSFLRNVYDAMYAKKIGEKRSALKFARTALYHLQTTEDARDKICANWLVGESLLEALSIDNSEPARNYILKEARRHLDQAQTDAQQNQLTDYEADTLLSLARWHRANAQLQEARDCCDEALHIAEDYGYRLKQADICNCIGYLELDSGRPKQAMKWAERAKKLAFWNHPTDQYMPAITEAEKLLKECRI
jgi:tetratricopeptide (TPR) repeat protein